MNEVVDFCTEHNACRDGSEFAKQFGTFSEAFDKCERGDWMMWALRKAGKLTKAQSVKLACEFALRVLPIYENKYLRKEPRLAIEAALVWIVDQTEDNRLACRNAAAYAADAADAAADAADAAADAAAYAAYAADAAAYAADAADAAADAADAAADAARLVEIKAQAEIIRSIVGNPWRAA